MATPVEAQALTCPAGACTGFKVEQMKVTVVAGERKPLMVSCTAPQQPKAGSLAALGLQRTLAATVTGWLKGGLPAPSQAAAGRRVVLTLQCVLQSVQ